jgi:hypothetical protein
MYTVLIPLPTNIYGPLSLKKAFSRKTREYRIWLLLEKTVLKVGAVVPVCSSSPLSVQSGERCGKYEVRRQSCEQIAIHISTPKKKMASERVKKRDRVVPTIATKLQIVERAENGESGDMEQWLLLDSDQPGYEVKDDATTAAEAS